MGGENEITWAKHKTKLADPVKTLAEAVNNELLTAFGKVIGGGGVTTYGLPEFPARALAAPICADPRSLLAEERH